jgi:hypothetical protein
MKQQKNKQNKPFSDKGLPKPNVVKSIPKPSKMKKKDFILSPVYVGGRKLYLKRYYKVVWLEALFSFSFHLARKTVGFNMIGCDTDGQPIAKMPYLDMRTSAEVMKKVDKVYGDGKLTQKQ